MTIDNLEQVLDYLTSVEEFADRVGLRDSFDRKLNHLCTPSGGRPSRVRLFKYDTMPHSFTFVKEYMGAGVWHFDFSGGLIYHGPSHGWSIHTL